MILISQDLMAKSALGMIQSNQNRTSPAFSRHLRQWAFLVFDIPPKQVLRGALISAGSSSPALPLMPCAWPTYFLIFPFFSSGELCFLAAFPFTVGVDAGQVWLHCILCLSLTLIVSLDDSHLVYLNDLGDTSSVSRQINHQINWHIYHKRGCL